MKSHFYLFVFLFFSALTNLSAQDDCVNRALHFDGTGDYVQLANSPIQGSVDFTVEIWFYSEDADGQTGCSGNMERIFCAGGARFELGVCEDDLSIVVNNTSATLITPINHFQWYHLAVTRTGNDVEVFLDCALVFSQSYGAFSLDNSFRLGRWVGGSAGDDQLWTGKLDELRIWDHALSPDEICANSECPLLGNELGLVDYYRFDQGVPNNSNPTVGVLEDLTVSPNDGTLYNFTLDFGTSNWVCAGNVLEPCCTNTAMHFDGQNDYLKAANSPVNGIVDFTIECMFYNEDADGQTGCSNNFERIIGCGGDRFELGVCDSDLAFVASSGSATSTGISINNNQWYHLAATRQGGTIKIYLDGVLVYTGTGFSGMSLDNNFTIGRWTGGSTGDNQTWAGMIDEVRVWSYARSLSQINDTKDCTLSGFGNGLLLYYTFEEGVGGINNNGVGAVWDNTANANDGSFHNLGLIGPASNYVCADIMLCDTFVSTKEQTPEWLQLGVFPNPAEDICTIQLTEPAQERFSVELYDSFGRLIREQIFNAGESRIELNLYDLPQAVYWISVRMQHKIVYSEPLIKL
ncbi:MAG: T9SS type A sorting domain-containing protein [Saprospiraceae bacterium]|nr:T9SS type A sorting domain-containing protein [Saprospiraceae bacterium]